MNKETYAKRRYHQFKKAGICVCCHRNKVTKYARCTPCLLFYADYNKTYRKKRFVKSSRRKEAIFKSQVCKSCNEFFERKWRRQEICNICTKQHHKYPTKYVQHWKKVYRLLA